MGLFRSLFGLLFILIGVAAVAAGLDRAPAAPDIFITYGAYIGAALILFGFILGKYWVIQIHRKPKMDTALSNVVEAKTAVEPQVVTKLDKPQGYDI